MSQPEDESYYEAQLPYETQFGSALPSSPVWLEDLEMEMEIRLSKESSKPTIDNVRKVYIFAI
jgi:hypothetical protein